MCCGEDEKLVRAGIRQPVDCSHLKTDQEHTTPADQPSSSEQDGRRPTSLMKEHLENIRQNKPGTAINSSSDPSKHPYSISGWW